MTVFGVRTDKDDKVLQFYKETKEREVQVFVKVQSKFFMDSKGTILVFDIVPLVPNIWKFAPVFLIPTYFWGFGWLIPFFLFGVTYLAFTPKFWFWALSAKLSKMGYKKKPQYLDSDNVARRLIFDTI